LEKGIYTIDLCTKQNTALTKEIKSLLEADADLMQKKAETEAHPAARNISPTTQCFLDNYSILTTEEKNRL
jgi:hypothetical protein